MSSINAKKIQILFVGLSSNLGGIEIFAKNLILNSDPNEICFTIMVENGVVIPYQDELKKHGVNIVSFYPKRKNYLKYLNSIKSIYSSEKFDIIHINLMTYSPFELIKYACKYSTGRVIVHSHNTGHKNKYYKTRILHMVGKMLLRKNNFEKIACGVEAGKYLFNDKPFRVFYNGIDFDRFRFSSAQRNKIRAELGVNDSTLVLGNVGHFVPRKNQKFLIDMFAALKNEYPNSKLVLVGVGPQLEGCKKYVVKNDLSDSVCFLGRRLDMNNIYSALDVFLLPSLNEGLSIAICEAQVNGLPCVVSTNISKESDISGNVFFLNLNDPKKWINIVSSSNCKRNTFNIIPDNFDISVATKRMLDYYAELISEDKRDA